MALVWDSEESQAFAARLGADLQVWRGALDVWRARVADVVEAVAAGRLKGAAYQAAKTFFEDRVQPLVTAGESVCAFTAQELDQHTAHEAPLLDDGAHINEYVLANVTGDLETQIHALTHWWELPTPWRDDDDDVMALKNQLAATHEALEDLRVFASRTALLFGEQADARESLQRGVESLANGSIGPDGVYVPAPGDAESWLGAVQAYVATHPVPRPVYDPNGQYGGNQGSPSTVWTHSQINSKNRQRIRDIVHRYYPEMSEDDIGALLADANGVGCSYVALLNTLAARYSSAPDEFERKFGFPLYQADGTVDFNSMFIDFFCATGTKDAQSPDRKGWFEQYLEDRGVHATFDYRGGSWGSAATMADYEDLAEKGDVILSISPLLMFRTSDGQDDGRRGSHAMAVTGAGSDARGDFLLLSSWGQEWKSYPSDFPKTWGIGDHFIMGDRFNMVGVSYD